MLDLEGAPLQAAPEQTMPIPISTGIWPSRQAHRAQFWRCPGMCRNLWSWKGRTSDARLASPRRKLAEPLVKHSVKDPHYLSTCLRSSGAEAWVRSARAKDASATTERAI